MLIIEDSPPQPRATSNTTPTLQTDAKESQAPTDSQVLADRLNLSQCKLEGEFDHITNQLRDGETQQNNIATAADALVASLQTALTALNISHQKHESAIHNNEQLNLMLKNNQDLMSKNTEMGQLPRSQLQATDAQEERRRNLRHQTVTLKQQQWTHQQQLGVRGQATLQEQQDMDQMRERNLDRANHPSQSSTCPRPVIHESRTGTGAMNDGAERHAAPTLGPREPMTTSTHNVIHHSTGTPPPDLTVSGHAQFGIRIHTYALFGVPEHGGGCLSGFYADRVPELEKEIKLWIAGQPGATVTQLLARLIRVLPLAVNTDALIYGTNRKEPTRSIYRIHYGHDGWSLW